MNYNDSQKSSGINFEEKVASIMKTLFPNLIFQYNIPNLKFAFADAALPTNEGIILFEIKMKVISKANLSEIIRRFYPFSNIKTLIIIAKTLNKDFFKYKIRDKDLNIDIYLLDLPVLEKFNKIAENFSYSEIKKVFLNFLQRYQINEPTKSSISRNWNLKVETFHKVPRIKLIQFIKEINENLDITPQMKKEDLITLFTSNLDEVMQNLIFQNFRYSGKFSSTIFNVPNLEIKALSKKIQQKSTIEHVDSFIGEKPLFKFAGKLESLNIYFLLYQRLGKKIKVKTIGGEIQDLHSIEEIPCVFHPDLNILEVRANSSSSKKVILAFEMNLNVSGIKSVNFKEDGLFELQSQAKEFRGVNYRTSDPNISTVSISTSGTNINDIPYYHSILENSKTITRMKLTIEMKENVESKVDILPDKGQINYLNYVGEDEIHYFLTKIRKMIQMN